MQNILVIFKKQLRDTFKNKIILIQFIMFPALALIMENFINIKDMPENFFTKLFAVMYIGMAPLVSASSVIAEEKEKDTLRVLMHANISPWQYLTGVGSYIWCICMMGAAVMSTALPSESRLFFLCIMAIGFVISIVAGACVGMFSKNQMMATSVVMPLMLVLAFVPMLAMFNDIIKKSATVFYTQQLRLAFEEMKWSAISSKSILIVAANALIFILLFAFIYRKKGLE